jgi:hypothetical protein
MLEPDAGPTRKSGSQRGAGRQRPAPTRQRGLRSPTLAMIFRISEALQINPSLLVAKTYDVLRQPF